MHIGANLSFLSALFCRHACNNPLPHVGTPHYYTVFTPPRQLGEKVHFTYLKENQNAFYYLELLATKKIKKMIS